MFWVDSHQAVELPSLYSILSLLGTMLLLIKPENQSNIIIFPTHSKMHKLCFQSPSRLNWPEDVWSYKLPIHHYSTSVYQCKPKSDRMGKAWEQGWDYCCLTHNHLSSVMVLCCSGMIRTDLQYMDRQYMEITVLSEWMKILQVTI